MNKVITFSDSNYFKYGQFFLKTRKNVEADFILYGPDLDHDQISLLSSLNITYRNIDPDLFNSKMQFLKFQVMHDEIDCKGGGVSFVDFDTLFVKDWSNIFSFDFDIGVTVRKDFVKKKIYRAYANGGVIFCKNSKKSKELCKYAMDVMIRGKDDNLKEYDFIFKTLEEGRPAHKTHYRTTLRWWVDQVFLSSLVLKNINEGGSVKGNEVFFNFKDYCIGMFDCSIYNLLDPSIGVIKTLMHNKTSYILHLKQQGRNKIEKIRRIL